MDRRVLQQKLLELSASAKAEVENRNAAMKETEANIPSILLADAKRSASAEHSPPKANVEVC